MEHIQTNTDQLAGLFRCNPRINSENEISVPKDLDEFAYVIHPKFGEGKIQKLVSGNAPLVIVDFADGTKKKLQFSLANLQFKTNPPPYQVDSIEPEECIKPFSGQYLATGANVVHSGRLDLGVGVVIGIQPSSLNENQFVVKVSFPYGYLRPIILLNQDEGVFFLVDDIEDRNLLSRLLYHLKEYCSHKTQKRYEQAKGELEAASNILANCRTVELQGEREVISDPIDDLILEDPDLLIKSNRGPAPIFHPRNPKPKVEPDSKISINDTPPELEPDTANLIKTVVELCPEVLKRGHTFGNLLRRSNSGSVLKDVSFEDALSALDDKVSQQLRDLQDQLGERPHGKIKALREEIKYLGVIQVSIKKLVILQGNIDQSLVEETKAYKDFLKLFEGIKELAKSFPNDPPEAQELALVLYKIVGGKRAPTRNESLLELPDALDQTDTYLDALRNFLETADSPYEFHKNVRGLLKIASSLSKKLSSNIMTGVLKKYERDIVLWTLCSSFCKRFKELATQEPLLNQLGKRAKNINITHDNSLEHYLADLNVVAHGIIDSGAKDEPQFKRRTEANQVIAFVERVAKEHGIELTHTPKLTNEDALNSAVRILASIAKTLSIHTKDKNLLNSLVDDTEITPSVLDAKKLTEAYLLAAQVARRSKNPEQQHVAIQLLKICRDMAGSTIALPKLSARFVPIQSNERLDAALAKARGVRGKILADTDSKASEITDPIIDSILKATASLQPGRYKNRIEHACGKHLEQSGSEQYIGNLEELNNLIKSGLEALSEIQKELPQIGQRRVQKYITQLESIRSALSRGNMITSSFPSKEALEELCTFSFTKHQYELLCETFLYPTTQHRKWNHKLRIFKAILENWDEATLILPDTREALELLGPDVSFAQIDHKTVQGVFRLFDDFDIAHLGDSSHYVLTEKGKKLFSRLKVQRSSTEILSENLTKIIKSNPASLIDLAEGFGTKDPDYKKILLALVDPSIKVFSPLPSIDEIFKPKDVTKSQRNHYEHIVSTFKNAGCMVLGSDRTSYLPTNAWVRSAEQLRLFLDLKLNEELVEFHLESVPTLPITKPDISTLHLAEPVTTESTESIENPFFGFSGVQGSARALFQQKTISQEQYEALLVIAVIADSGAMRGSKFPSYNEWLTKSEVPVPIESYNLAFSLLKDSNLIMGNNSFAPGAEILFRQMRRFVPNDT